MFYKISIINIIVKYHQFALDFVAERIMNYSLSQINLSQPIDSQDSGIEMETQPMMPRNNHQYSIRPSFASSSR